MEANANIPPNSTVQTNEPISTGSGSRRFFIAIWVVIIGLLALVAWGLINNSQGRPLVGDAAPDFHMEFFNGYGWVEADAEEVAHLVDMHGRPIVLNFWASWCVECHLEAELLENLSREYGDRVLFLGIAYVDTPTKSLEYLESYGISYPNAPDLGGVISKDYEITGVPETFIIDAEGTIADVVIGPVNEVRLRTILEQLLNS